MKHAISRMFWLLTLTIALLVGFTAQASAAFPEEEPNNTQATAQTISLNQKISGSMDGNDDEDHYRFTVKEGYFYEITLNDVEDPGNFLTLIADLCKEGATAAFAGDTVINGDISGSKTVLFRADYSGNYYLKFWNDTDTTYSFVVRPYRVKDISVKDMNSNTYRFINDKEVEITKTASKNMEEFYFSSDLRVDRINDIPVIGAPEIPITTIGKKAFKNCKKLTSVSIGGSVKRIKANAFENCKKLGTESYIMGLVIDNSGVVIEENAFKNCKNLGSIRIVKGASVKSVASKAFAGTKKGIRIEVPNVKKYKKIFKKAGLKNPKYSKTYI